jgi:hypothetical protein
MKCPFLIVLRVPILVHSGINTDLNGRLILQQILKKTDFFRSSTAAKENLFIIQPNPQSEHSSDQSR